MLSVIILHIHKKSVLPGQEGQNFSLMKFKDKKENGHEPMYVSVVECKNLILTRSNFRVVVYLIKTE